MALVEVKLTEDYGTVRDKVARNWRLRTLQDAKGNDYSLVVCVAGHALKARRDDMRRLLQGMDGKVSTLATMHLLIDHSPIQEYRDHARRGGDDRAALLERVRSGHGGGHGANASWG